MLLLPRSATTDTATDTSRLRDPAAVTASPRRADSHAPPPAGAWPRTPADRSVLVAVPAVAVPMVGSPCLRYKQDSGPCQRLGRYQVRNGLSRPMNWYLPASLESRAQGWNKGPPETCCVRPPWGCAGDAALLFPSPQTIPSSSHTSSLPAAEPSLLLGGLDFLWLEITGKCNLNCTSPI